MRIVPLFYNRDNNYYLVWNDHDNRTICSQTYDLICQGMFNSNCQIYLNNNVHHLT